ATVVRVSRAVEAPRIDRPAEDFDQVADGGGNLYGVVEGRMPIWAWVSLAFLVPFALSLVWIWQGFDLTDEGLHLTLQWLLISRGQISGSEMMWLTNVVGGLWQQVVGGWGLIGARFGWALLM